MKPTFRCPCPFTSALDVLGDKWMLVLVKQMLLEDKQTFKDFMAAEEAIATNILASKLKLLEANGIVRKTKLPGNKKTNLYLLTKKGLALAPVLAELATWSDSNLRDVHPNLLGRKEMKAIREDKPAFARQVVAAYRKKWASLDQELEYAEAEERSPE